MCVSLAPLSVGSDDRPDEEADEDEVEDDEDEEEGEVDDEMDDEEEEEEERRTSGTEDGEVKHSGSRPKSRRMSALDSRMRGGKPIPKGSSFFVFSHTNRLEIGSQSNLILLFVFVFLSFFPSRPFIFRPLSIHVKIKNKSLGLVPHPMRLFPRFTPLSTHVHLQISHSPSRPIRLPIDRRPLHPPHPSTPHTPLADEGTQGSYEDEEEGEEGDEDEEEEEEEEGEIDDDGSEKRRPSARPRRLSSSARSNKVVPIPPYTSFFCLSHTNR